MQDQTPPRVEPICSLIGVAANVASAAALTYLVYKYTRPQPDDLFQALPRRRSKDSMEAEEPDFQRQVSVAMPELTKNAFALRDSESMHAKAVAFQRERGDSVVIKDTPEAMIAMKSVFKRLCQSSSELLTIEDVMKVHNLLGEPMDQSDVPEMMQFFGAKESSELCVSFDDFMGWWSKLHDSSADPDQYYSQERYRQRFKVLQSRLKDPNISRITTVEEGEITSRRYRVHFEMDGHRLSPWHDIPLKNSDGSLNFICEIPKWTRKKFEIATGEAMNPIKQDVKNGVLREYKWGDMLFNYGAFPQTWEDPKHVSEETGCPGDNDPVDVIELGTRQRPVGSITRVKVIGVIAMIDSDETDWKVLAIALDDDKAKHINDLVDLDAHMPGVTSALTHWLRMYKTADGKGENKFGCGGKPQGAGFATKIVEETHESWRQLTASMNKEGKMKKVASGGNFFTELTV